MGSSLTDSEVASLVQRYADIAWDFEHYDSFFAADYVAHTRIGDFKFEDFREVMRSLRRAFPDGEYTPLDTVAQGDKIAMRYAFAGTHQAEFMGIPASGKNVRIEGLEIDRFEDGKMVETWNFSDIMGLMQQIGALP